MAHGIISNLARLAGIPVQTLWSYCQGKHRASPARARILEGLTGISRLAWLEGDIDKIQAGLSALVITWKPQTGLVISKPENQPESLPG